MWRGPGENSQTARKDDAPHIRPESIDSGHLLPREKAFRNAGFCVWNSSASGHAAAPTRKIEGAYRPSSVSADAEPPSPRGRHPSEARGRLHRGGKSPAGGAPYSPAGKIPKIGKNPEKIRFSLTNGGKRTIIYKVILSLGFPGPENSEIISERKLKYV